MLHVEGLTVRYGRSVAVDDVSLEVRSGELVGLVGPNGAGKTSILSAIAGLVPPASGSIAFESVSLAGRTPESIARAGMCLVKEGRHIFTRLTVEENLRLGLIARRNHGSSAEDLDRELTRFPALRSLYGKPAGRLSGGEQQQLAIARALISRPRLLMLDEPSFGLSPKMMDAVFDVVSGLVEEGITVLLVEQNAVRTIKAADRTYVLRSGRVALSGDRAELAATADLATAYLGV